MSHKQMDYGLAHRLAIEQQLLAEEKWVVEALKKVKKQRNSLQIERLHLTSLHGRLLMQKRGLKSKTTLESDPLKPPEASVSDEFKLVAVSIDDDVCNAEELNLTVPQHTFHNPTNSQMEEIEEFDNNELDDYEIDMNMLMNGIE